MAIRKLDQIFNPKRIAVVGASPNPQTVGAKLITNLVGGGFAGVVYPVNPTSEAVLGIQCYPDVKSLPKTPDLGVICTPAQQVPELVRQCGEAGILGLVIASAGFRESWPEGKALEDAVAAEIERFDGGRPAADVDRVIEILMRLSYLAADYPEIVELDVNPLLVGPKTVVALDARVALDPELLGREVKPYSHLALRPYPEDYVRPAKLRDGRDIILRPIKPEDEPMWFELLRSCSKESLYQRFRYFFHWETHEVASRYCFIHYDREIAIVPELEEDGVRKLLGVGRLVADPDHQAVEYAILVGDAWQNMGLGGLLTEYCIEIARHWDLDRIVAQTATDNVRMLTILKKYGFETVSEPGDSTVEVIKQLKA